MGLRSAAHAFQGSVESGAFPIPRLIAREQDHDAGIAVIDQGIFEYPQLQAAVGHFLFPAILTAAVTEEDCNPGAFQPVPERSHLRWH